MNEKLKNKKTAPVGVSEEALFDEEEFTPEEAAEILLEIEDIRAGRSQVYTLEEVRKMLDL